MGFYAGSSSESPSIHVFLGSSCAGLEGSSSELVSPRILTFFTSFGGDFTSVSSSELVSPKILTFPWDLTFGGWTFGLG